MAKKTTAEIGDLCGQLSAAQAEWRKFWTSEMPKEAEHAQFVSAMRAMAATSGMGTEHAPELDQVRLALEIHDSYTTADPFWWSASWEWAAKFDSFAEAEPWIGAGWSPWQAREAAAAGMTPETAAKLLQRHRIPFQILSNLDIGGEVLFPWKRPDLLESKEARAVIDTAKRLHDRADSWHSEE